MKLARSRTLVTLLSALAAPALISSATRPAMAQGKATHEEIALAVGETRTLSAVGVKEYSEGVKGIVDVVPTPDGRTFVLTGKKAGSTTLLLIRGDGSTTNYDISVASRNPAQVEKEIQQLLEGIPGIHTRRVGSRIFIEGGVSTEAELKRVQQIAAPYAGQVEVLAERGFVSERKLLIRLDFFFVQYEKTSGYNVGLAWPNAIGGLTPQGQPIIQNNYVFDFISRTSMQAQASVVNQPLPRLDVAARRGWVKVAKQSSVITANGNEASFESGGEQNFIITAGLTTQLARVLFGTNVKVFPRYDSNTRDVEIKLAADVSDLTPPQTSGGPPGRTTTKLDTTVTLKLGQALVLSGIKTASQRHSVSGLPGLSAIPILGLLFGSHADDKIETEGAVFIVPSVVDTVPKSAVELINNTMAVYRDYTGEIEYVDSYPKTPPSAK